MIKQYFASFSTELWPLIDVEILFINAQYLVDQLMDFDKVLFMHIYIYMIHVVTNTHYFPELFLSYDP